MTCSGIIENLTMGLSAYLQHQKYVGNPGIEAKKKKNQRHGVFVVEFQGFNIVVCSKIILSE